MSNRIEEWRELSKQVAVALTLGQYLKGLHPGPFGERRTEKEWHEWDKTTGHEAARIAKGLLDGINAATAGD